MHRTSLVPILLFLPGCDLLGDLAGYTNPLVMEATLVGVEAPDETLVDLTGTSFEGGTAATVLLADATKAEDLEAAPVEGATVELQLDGGSWMPFRDDADGKYIIDEGLGYRPGQEIRVRVRGGVDGEHGAVIRAPEPLDVEIEPLHEAGRALALHTGAPGIAHLAAVVMDVATGELLFDNRPVTIEEVYDLTHGGGQLSVEIPGVVFSRAGDYVVGVAGLAVTDEDGLENVNTTISALTAGTIRFYPVHVDAPTDPG